MPTDSSRLTPSDFYTYYQPSLCDLRVYLRARGEAEALPGPFAEILRRLGERHEASHLAAFPGVLNLAAVPLSQRLEATRQAVAARAPVIYHPRLCHPLTITGQVWEICGEPDLLLADPNGYVIRDVKLSRRIGEREHPEIHRQLQLYGWLYQQSFGQPPAKLEVYTGAATLEPIPFDHGQAALDLLRQITEIQNASAAPYSPVGWSKCNGCGFRPYCWPRAEANQDVALLPGVDQGLAVALHERGFSTRTALLKNLDEATLAALRRPRGSGQSKVGKQAKEILLHAQAFEQKSKILLAKPDLPPGDHFVMFDLEGLPPQLDELQKIYLWGMQVYGKRPGRYQPALAGFGADGDANGWREFLRQAEMIFNTHGDLPFVHWHHYETTNLRLYLERYGDPQGIAGRVLANCLDLHKVTRQAVVLPVPSYSLKVVEKYLGFKRTLEEYGGEWAMAKYIEAVETEDEAERQAHVREIMLYNEEDLAAMWAVWEWLSALETK
jgi:predicted RecB family nuclease